ncbi:hypothetical protein N431DRAFT_278717, partial [Stipitochalara longipes BDJ]
ISLDKSPPYDALSYAWGSDLSKHIIHIDGQELFVGANLYAALKVLQNSREIRYIWVDAICINQADVTERNQQVSIMNAIYRNANRVVVWLGPEADDSDFAIQTIQSWRKHIPKAASLSDKTYWEKVASIKHWDPIFFGPSGTTANRAWLAIRKLWERNWWRRAWIVQEATLSPPQRLELLCGDQSIYWDDFVVSIDIAHFLESEDGFGTLGNWQQSFPTRLHSFRVDRESGYYLRLLMVLQHMRSYECGDDRDKVFAALGMAADVSLDEITPDYQMSVENTYINVVRLVLGASELHRLDFLGYVVRQDGSDPEIVWIPYKDLPTWVPDWRNQITSSIIEKHQNTDDPGSGRLFCASGQSKVEAKVDGRRLLVKGMRIDAVKLIYPVCGTHRKSVGLTTQKTWREAMPQADYISGGTVAEAFDRTIVTDIVQDDPPHDYLYKRGHWVDWSLLESDPLSLDESDLCKRHALEVALNRITFARRLFWTNGGYLGLGPAGMTERDVICVFHGGQVLYVLRDAGTGVYEFLGECYVHGLMDGEAIKEEARWKEQTFTII